MGRGGSGRGGRHRGRGRGQRSITSFFNMVPSHTVVARGVPLSDGDVAGVSRSVVEEDDKAATTVCGRHFQHAQHHGDDGLSNTASSHPEVQTGTRNLIRLPSAAAAPNVLEFVAAHQATEVAAQPQQQQQQQEAFNDFETVERAVPMDVEDDARAAAAASPSNAMMEKSQVQHIAASTFPKEYIAVSTFPKESAFSWTAEAARGDLSVRGITAATAANAGETGGETSATRNNTNMVDPGFTALPHHPWFAASWAKAVKVLCAKPMTTVDDLIGAMWALSPQKQADHSRLRAFRGCLESVLGEDEVQMFLTGTLPGIVDLVLRLPVLFPRACVRLLEVGVSATVTLSRLQVASLLAACFFDLVPSVALVEQMALERAGDGGTNSSDRNRNRGRFRRGGYNDFSFRRILATLPQYPSQIAKFRCLSLYFRRVSLYIQQGDARFMNGSVSFMRQAMLASSEELVKDLQSARVPLCSVDVRESGTIEDVGDGTINVDFANKYIGGGVMGRGCVQEEIRFMINTECLVSLLLTECLEEHESLFIIGAERFCTYTGYASSFAFSGNFLDESPVDQYGRLASVIVAIDALPYRSWRSQFRRSCVVREIRKAVAGFAVPPQFLTSVQPLAGHSWPAARSAIPYFRTFSTGNWGCGAFNGDIPLKCMVQVLAASLAGCSLRYFTFGEKVASMIPAVMHHLRSRGVAVRQLWRAMCIYADSKRQRGGNRNKYNRGCAAGLEVTRGSAPILESAYEKAATSANLFEFLLRL